MPRTGSVCGSRCEVVEHEQELVIAQDPGHHLKLGDVVGPGVGKHLQGAAQAGAPQRQGTGRARSGRRHARYRDDLAADGERGVGHQANQRKTPGTGPLERAWHGQLEQVFRDLYWAIVLPVAYKRRDTTARWQLHGGLYELHGRDWAITEAGIE